MRYLLTILIALAGGAVRRDDTDRAPDIVTVLFRSQQLRLAAMTLADPDSPRAHRLRASFDALTTRLRIVPPVELRIIRGDIVAETVHGNIVVANEALGDLPEGERIFVLAHELGHVMLGHWSQMGLLYQRWIPGAVERRHTDAVAAPLGRDASALAHRQEFEADVVGLRAVRALGLPEHDVLAAFMDLGVRNDTATHPGTMKRVAALRAIEADRLQAAATPTPER
jgi:Zn-dependent protease with chaperone function